VRRELAYHNPRAVFAPCSLIIVPHGLQNQWESELRATNIDYCTNKAFRTSATACIVPATQLADFHADNPYIHFKRVIIDEADTITIRCQPDIKASFYWFVTATYTALDVPGRHTAGRPMYMKNLRYFHSTGLGLGDVTVRSNTAWVDDCMRLPPVLTETTMCAMPAYMNVVMGSSLSASITEMLSAGDVEGAILAMGGDSQTQTNLVSVLTGRMRQDMERLEARATYLEQVGSTVAAAAVRQTIQSKNGQLQAIQERLSRFKEEACAICLEELSTTGSQVVMHCCNHLFCAPCLTRWRLTKQTCPMCRACPFNFTLIRSEANNPQPIHSRPRPMMSKEEALVHIITSRPQGRFIVFSNYDRTFATIESLMAQHRISCRVLKGTPAAFKKILADHEHGVIRVLLMNSRFDGAGHSMQWVTDAITYHKLSDDALAQVTGRGMRPGRSCPLTMHHLRWQCEV
jgi:hypothetical protein